MDNLELFVDEDIEGMAIAQIDNIADVRPLCEGSHKIGIVFPPLICIWVFKQQFVERKFNSIIEIVISFFVWSWALATQNFIYLKMEIFNVFLTFVLQH